LFLSSSLLIMLADDPSKQSILKTDPLEASMHLGGSRLGVSPKVFTVGLLVTSNPVLTLLFTAIFLRDLEAINLRVIIGALLTVTGTILVVRPSTSNPVSNFIGRYSPRAGPMGGGSTQMSWWRRDARWSEAIAAGSLTFVEKVKSEIEITS
jgi:hypothetical protein